MKVDVWYRAVWHKGSASIIVKRVSSIVIFHGELAGLISYKVIKYHDYNQFQFVPDYWIITELSSLEQEML